MKIIIGAGITGLTIANHLNGEFFLFEKSSRIGGLSGQYQENGFWFDYSGHYFHFKNRLEIKTYLENISTFRCYRRKSKIFLNNKYIPFPMQNHLSFLPKRLGRTILKEIPQFRRQQGKNLQEVLKFNFGDHLYNLFFEPFLEKYYLKNPEKLLASMDKGSIPVPDKETMIKGFEGKRFDREGYNPVFFYPVVPLRNFIAKMAEPVIDRIKINEAVESIDLINKKIYTQSNQYEYDKLVNTIPLKEFLKRARPQPTFPEYHLLENISTQVVNVVLKRRKKRYHWVYIPEKNIPFYRVGFYPGSEHTSCYLEMAVSPKSAEQKTNIEIDTITSTLKKLKIIENQDDIVYLSQRIIPVSHVIFNLHWKKTVPSVLKKLEKMDVYSIGRYGSWNYSSMSGDIQQAIGTANKLNEK